MQRADKKVPGLNAFSYGGPQVTPDSVAIDAINVYWTYTDNTNGSINRCPLTGCGMSDAVATGQAHPTSIFSDGANLFWVDANSGLVMMSNKPTGAGMDAGPTTLVKIATGQGSSTSVVADTSYAYWFNGFGEVWRANRADGSNPSRLATGQGKGYLALDGGFLYWTSTQSQHVMRCSTGGCGLLPSDLGGGPLGVPLGLAIYNGAVYWTAQDRILKCTVNGCPGSSPMSTLATGQVNAWYIAVDATGVYWTNNSSGTSGTVMRLVE